MIKIETENDDDIGDEPVNVKLTQNDFLTGTYRITKSGVYTLTEDIVFDFNAGDLSNPNDGRSWLPECDQRDQYPGACEWDGYYWYV